MADLNVTFRGPSMQLSITFTSSVSMMLQHWPTDVTGCSMLFRLFGADGTAYDSQYPRHAFVFIENWTQSGISIFRLWPKLAAVTDNRREKWPHKSDASEMPIMFWMIFGLFTNFIAAGTMPSRIFAQC